MQRKTLAILAALLIAGAALPCAADSLWPQNGASLFADNKAFQVGDIVTVIVQESATASNSAGSSLSKASSTDAQIDTTVMPTGFQSTRMLFEGETDPQVNMSSTRTFDGSGSYSLSGTMSTSITAIVKEVLPNGNMIVEGKRVRQSADETVVVKVSGIVRPADITTDNMVASTALAQANITMESMGPIARSSKRGWMDRCIDIVWPF